MNATAAPTTDELSEMLARRLARNPLNLSGPDHLCAHDLWAIRFEQEGANAYRGSTGGNPYNAGTMAHDRWAKGFMDARATDLKGRGNA